jgi:uncharacterized protein (TIRG00374 family)
LNRILKSLWIKISVAAVLLTWLLVRSEPDKIFNALRSLPAGLFLCLLILYVFSFAVNACKWRFLLRGQRFWRLFRLILVANYYSLIIPGQVAGEAVKVVRLSRGISNPESIAASVAFDRFTGLMSILLVTFFGLAFGSASDVFPFWTGYLLVPAVFLSTPILLRSRSVARGLKKVLLRGRGLVPARYSRKFWPHALGFIDACQQYCLHPQRLAGATLLGILLQGICIGIVMVLGENFDIHLNFIDWCWVFGLVSLAVFVPVSIGGIGLREGSFVFCLLVFGIAEEKALALSIALFSLQLTSALVGALSEFVLCTAQRYEFDFKRLSPNSS